MLNEKRLRKFTSHSLNILHDLQIPDFWEFPTQFTCFFPEINFTNMSTFHINESKYTHRNFPKVFSRMFLFCGRKREKHLQGMRTMFAVYNFDLHKVVKTIISWSFLLWVKNLFLWHNKRTGTQKSFNFPGKKSSEKEKFPEFLPHKM
jgi:hypothetical protein